MDLMAKKAKTRNSIEYPMFANCYGKANKKRMPWHSET